MWTFLVVSVIPLLNETHSPSWYFMLYNGSDTKDCGRSVDSACLSLLHVLNLYYAKPPTEQLAIMIDIPLEINKNFLVSLSWLKCCTTGATFIVVVGILFRKQNCIFLFQKLCPAFRSSSFVIQTLTQAPKASVIVTDIDFYMSVWSVMNLNLNFTNCQLRSSQIKTATTRLQVSNCQVRSSFQIFDGLATFVNCTILSSKISSQSPLIDAKNSTVILKSSQVVNWQGEGFLQISEGIGKITGVKFVNCTAAFSLIIAIHHTTLVADNCTFVSSTGTSVKLYNNSVGSVHNSLFQDNRISDSHSKQNYSLGQCYLGSYLQLKNSHFVNNTILSNASVVCVIKSIVFLQNCSFKNNRASDVMGIVSILKGILRMNTTIFSNNTGGAVHLYNSSNFVISKCLFQDNHANALNVGGAIRCIGQGKVHKKGNFWNDLMEMLETQHLPTANATRPVFVAVATNSEGMVSNCSFIGNIAQHGGAIAAKDVGLILSFNVFENNFNSAVYLDHSPANFTQCTFHGNNGHEFGGAISSVWASLSVISSVFTENEFVGHFYGGAISFGMYSTLTVFNSTFCGNRGSMGGAIYGYHAVNAYLCESTFVGNSGKSGGAIFISAGDAVLQECHFESNTGYGSGGALSFDFYSNARIIQTQFINNTSAGGGAVSSFRNSSLFCNLSTFYNNSAKLKQVYLLFVICFLQ